MWMILITCAELVLLFGTNLDFNCEKQLQSLIFSVLLYLYHFFFSFFFS